MDADLVSLLKILGGAGGGLAIAWKWIQALRDDLTFHRGELLRWETKYDTIVEQQRALLTGLADGLSDSREE